MAKHIGVVACSAEGAALCYRTICAEAAAVLGEHAHPEITMHTHPLSEYMVFLERRDWEGVAELMLSSTRKLSTAGAQFAICPDNTIHQAYGLVAARSPIPWLHIAEVVGDEASLRGFRHLGVLGTRFLMEGPVYPDALRRRGIESEIPCPSDRDKIHEIIFKELVYGILREESRLWLSEVIAGLRGRGCDAVVLGCTEIPLLMMPDDCPLPALDSTRLLAMAALRHAIG